MIGDIGIDECIDIEKPKRRKKRADKEKGAGQRRPAAASHRHQNGESGQDCGRKDPGAQARARYRPSGIDEDQVRRPQQLGSVEPGGPARQKHALQAVQPEGRSLGPAHVTFNPTGEKPRRGAEDEPGQQGRHVAAPGESPCPPPAHDKQGGGKCRRHSLAEEGQGKEKRGNRVSPPLPPLGKAQVVERGQQVKHRRKRVLLLGDPGYRFDAYRMQRENERGQPGPRNRQPAQDQQQQGGRGRVQGHVEEVVADRRVPPHPVLDPEGRMQQGIILLGRADLEPDPSEPGQGAQRRRRHVVAVIPDEPCPKDRRVGRKGR